MAQDEIVVEMKLTQRELGTVLAALHHWAETHRKASSMNQQIAGDDGCFKPLTAEETVALASRINGNDEEEAHGTT